MKQAVNQSIVRLQPQHTYLPQPNATMSGDVRQAKLLKLQVDLACEASENNLLLYALLLEMKKRKKKRRTLWVRPWLLRRPLYGQYEKLLEELQLEDGHAFRNFIRMDGNLFMELLDRVHRRIEKQDTFYRKALSPGLKLAITLRYLASGDNYKSLSYGFRVAHNTISVIVPDTCEAIIAEYMNEVLACPTTPEQWKEVASLFSNKWNFHNTVGALDGKHIAIKCPPNGGSHYYNYKGYHSIVLLALVDADYKFIYIDVGKKGCSSDGGIFYDTPLREGLQNDTLGLPDSEPLPGDDVPLPYFVIGDDAFALRHWMMKPFPDRNMTRQQRIFNYRLSRARRVVENTFGIMTSR